MAAVGESLHLIDSGESALAQLLDGLVEAMEAELVEAASKVLDPDVDHALVCQDELDWACVCSGEDETHASGGW